MPASGPRVTGLSVTPVKATRLHRVESIELDADGARGNRRFFVADESGRMVNGKVIGEFQTVVATCADDRLALTFPDGRTIASTIELGDPLELRFFSAPVPARPVLGPHSEALSDHVGRPLRLMEGAPAVDRGRRGGVSLVSQGSLARLAEVAGESGLDARRFRMLIEIDGVAAHDEDGWVGRTVRIGDATVRFHGHVGRCLITSRDPDTGVVDLPTLDLLGEYRRDVDSTEPLPFGIYGEVVAPGPVRVGDPLRPD
jgi:hypothetical protein